MAPGEHRPRDEEYWIPAWASVLFSGDLFEAVPFGGPSTEIVEGEDETGSTKHYVGDVSFAYGLLVSPTCDMYEQRGDHTQPAHPFRVLVPVLPLGKVAEVVEAIEDNVRLRIRCRTFGNLERPVAPGEVRNPLPVPEGGHHVSRVGGSFVVKARKRPNSRPGKLRTSGSLRRNGSLRNDDDATSLPGPTESSKEAGKSTVKGSRLTCGAW